MRIKKFFLYSADLSPSFGTEPGKIRPVVVVQTDLLNGKHASTVICPLTSNVIPELELLRVHVPCKGNKLKVDSDILIDQIRAIDNRRFVELLGELNREQKERLLENLKIVLLE